MYTYPSPIETAVCTAPADIRVNTLLLLLLVWWCHTLLKTILVLCCSALLTGTGSLPM
jgi:hypothetical protein